MATSGMRRQTSTRVTNGLGNRSGRRTLESVRRDTGARWPGLAVPILASLAAVVAFQLPGSGVGMRALRSLLGAGAAASWMVQLFVRPWQLTWGATDSELRHQMPGDAIIAAPWLEATRAVTIDAPAVVIWPWLREAHLLPVEFEGRGTLEQAEHRKTLVMGVHEGDRALATTAVLLEPLSEEHTRVVVRVRLAPRLGPSGLLAAVRVDRDFARTRHQLLLLKAVAEDAWRRASPELHAAHPLQSPNQPEPGEQPDASGAALPPEAAGPLVEG